MLSLVAALIALGAPDGRVESSDVDIATLATATAGGSCGFARSCTPSLILQGRTLVPAADVRPLWPELRERCALSGDLPDEPPGLFALWNVDTPKPNEADNVDELVFVGGCDPDPFFVIYRRDASQETVNVPVVWKQWERDRGRLVAINARFDTITLVSLVDGYGAARDSTVTVIERQGNFAPVVTRFRAIEPLDPVDDGAMVTLGKDDGWPESVVALRAAQTLGLRSSARIDDAPRESGMGFDYPGNLIQVYARNTPALLLRRRLEADGKEWSLVLMPDRPTARINIVKAMKTPWSPPDAASVAGGSFVWGWVPSSSLKSPTQAEKAPPKTPAPKTTPTTSTP